MNTFGSFGTVLLFAVGVLVGTQGHAFFNPPPPPNPYPSLAKVGEPRVTANVAAALLNNDERTLATLLEDEVLQQLQQAISGMIEFEEVKFTNAAASRGRILAGYIVQGRDAQRQREVVGVVLHVVDGEVVGVN